MTRKPKLAPGQRSLLSFWKKSDVKTNGVCKKRKRQGKEESPKSSLSETLSKKSESEGRTRCIGDGVQESCTTGVVKTPTAKLSIVSPNEKFGRTAVVFSQPPVDDIAADSDNENRESYQEEADAKQIESTKDSAAIDSLNEENDETRTDGNDDSDDNDNDHDSNEEETKTTFTDSLNYTENEDLCEYELLRLKNIARNNARLMELGLIDRDKLVETQRSASEPKRFSRKRVKARTVSAAPTEPTRRSRRIQNTAPQNTMQNEAESAAHAVEPGTTVQQDHEQAEQYEVSAMVQYAMGDIDKSEESSGVSSNNWGLEQGKHHGEITSLSPVGTRLVPPQGLQAIYTLQFYHSSASSQNGTWVVGAGKSGIVALWDCQESDPILSWKAHGGRWISDARFLPGPSTSPSRLVTAANDGTVCLWDLTTTSVTSGTPKLTCRTGKELHTSGIFAMDLLYAEPNQEAMIGTGSKDKSVAVLSLDMLTSSNEAPLWRSNFHSAKVAAVKFKDSSTLASASDDGRVAIHDFRRSGNENPVVVLDGAHTRPHSIVWDPMQEHVFLTAGLDHEMKTWDMRSLNEPLCSYYGHVPSMTKRCKKIHHPIFYNPGSMHSFILSGGEGSHSLSMFQSGKPKRSPVFSRGAMPGECGDVGSIAVDGEKVVTSVDGGDILMLAPRCQ